MTMRSFLIYFLVCSPLLCFGQNEGNIWYFGENAGLSFNSDPPVALTDGQLNTLEGCATIADASGNLLFYTDGTTIWNRNHLVMENGTLLGGDPSSTQSGVIVPNPDDDQRYFVFSVDAQIGQLLYAIVDISLNGGLGSVISSNNLLLNEATEKITAVQHGENNGIWVLGHEWGNNRFYAWLIDESGNINAPVISSVGVDHSGNDGNAIGYMKFSPIGDKVALAIFEGRVVETFDFDMVNGTLSNPQTITGIGGGDGPYGIEFSPNGDWLYFTESGSAPCVGCRLIQIDVDEPGGDLSTISHSVIDQDRAFGAIQVAPDNKLYVAELERGYLHAINSPNNAASAIDYELDATFLGGAITNFGLPTFIQSFFRELSFEAVGFCVGTPTQFIAESSVQNPDSVFWDYGDGNADWLFSTINTSHTYSTAGTYTVTLTLYFNGRQLTHEEEVIIDLQPIVSLGNDTTLFFGEVLDLDATNVNATYLWNDGSNQPTFTVADPGEYSVSVTSGSGCIANDTILVTYDQLIDVSLGNDTIICANESIDLDLFQDGLTYQWSTGATSSSITVSQASEVSVTITNAYGNRTLQDTILITVASPTALISNTDTVLLRGERLQLLGEGGVSYEWRPATYLDDPLLQRPTTTPDDNITYTLQVTDEFGCQDEAAINLILQLNLVILNTFTPNGDGINDTWFIENLDRYDNHKVWIFDRLGNQLLEFEDYQNDWNGTANGTDLPTGTYFYRIDLGNTQENRGSITIIR